WSLGTTSCEKLAGRSSWVTDALVQTPSKLRARSLGEAALGAAAGCWDWGWASAGPASSRASMAAADIEPRGIASSSPAFLAARRRGAARPTRPRQPLSSRARLPRRRRFQRRRRSARRSGAGGDGGFEVGLELGDLTTVRAARLGLGGEPVQLLGGGGGGGGV